MVKLMLKKILLVCVLIALAGCSGEKKSGVAIGGVSEKQERDTVFCGPFFVPREKGIDGVILLNEGFKSNVLNTYSFVVRDRSFLSNFVMEFGTEKTLVKFINLPREIFQHGNTFTITQNNRQVVHGALPVFPTKNRPFTFLVTSDLEEKAAGNLRKGCSFIRADSVAFETFPFLEKLMLPDVSLVLMTGDLARGGGTYARAWQEFFDGLKNFLNHSFFTSTAGFHDVERLFGYAEKTRKFLMHSDLWDFFHTSRSYFGNLFCFQEPAGVMPIVDQVEKIQGWFDIGSVRFIFLPIVTLGQDDEDEETPLGLNSVPAVEKLKKDVAGLIERLEEEVQEVRSRPVSASYDEEFVGELRAQIDGLKRMSLVKKDRLNGALRYTSQKVVDTFVKDVELARKAKQAGLIQFIVVCGHVPLVTSPRYQTSHQGLFEIKRGLSRHAIGQIEECFKAGGIDVYLCGHNHLYDRVVWNGIPMITVGFGTQLRTSKPGDSLSSRIKFCKKTVQGNEVVEGKFIDGNRIKNGRFIAALLCRVDPEKQVMTFTLVGKSGEVQEGERLEQADVQVYDEFVVNASKN